MYAAAMQQLHETGHSGRQFAPYIARVCGAPDAMKPGPADKMTPYLVPAIEMRRLMAEAIVAADAAEPMTGEGGEGEGEGGGGQQEGFFVEYMRYPRAVGNATLPSVLVRVVRTAAGEIHCRVHDPAEPSSSVGKECEKDEVALLPPPSAWADKLLLYFPFPLAVSSSSGGGGGSGSDGGSSDPTQETLGCIC
jgi:hypothetical protein